MPISPPKIEIGLNKVKLPTPSTSEYVNPSAVSASSEFPEGIFESHESPDDGETSLVGTNVYQNISPNGERITKIEVAHRNPDPNYGTTVDIYLQEDGFDKAGGQVTIPSNITTTT